MMIRTKATTLQRLWPAVEEVLCLTAVEAEWRSLTGAEFIHLQPFLLAEPEPAKSYPNPNGNIPYMVVTHGPDDIVGVCPETHDVIPLRREQLVVYKLHLQTLSLQIASALGLKSAEPVEASTARLFRLGNRRVGGGNVSVFMLFPRDVHDLELAKMALVMGKQTPFLLITPTDQRVNGTTHVQLRSMGCGAMALADALTVDGKKWSICEEAILTALPDQPIEDVFLNEREQTFLIAMRDMDACDGDRRKATAAIAESALGRDADANALKQITQSLAKKQLIGTKDGRGGGCWLTAKGFRRATKLKKELDGNG